MQGQGIVAAWHAVRQPSCGAALSQAVQPSARFPNSVRRRGTHHPLWGSAGMNSHAKYDKSLLDSLACARLNSQLGAIPRTGSPYFQSAATLPLCRGML